MAQDTKVARKARVATVPPTREQADAFAKQVGNLMVVDQALDSIIDADVRMGDYDSPFEHPLYAIRIKLDALRGRKGKRIATYARSLRKNGAVKKAA